MFRGVLKMELTKKQIVDLRELDSILKKYHETIFLYSPLKLEWIRERRLN